MLSLGPSLQHEASWRTRERERDDGRAGYPMWLGLSGPSRPPSSVCTCAFIAAGPRGQQKVLEPLLLLSSGAAEQEEGDRPLAVRCRCCRLPLRPLTLLPLIVEQALLANLPLGQCDADGVLPVPQPLPGQTRRQKRHLNAKCRETVVEQVRINLKKNLFKNLQLIQSQEGEAKQEENRSRLLQETAKDTRMGISLCNSCTELNSTNFVHLKKHINALKESIVFGYISRPFCQNDKRVFSGWKKIAGHIRFPALI